MKYSFLLNIIPVILLVLLTHQFSICIGFIIIFAIGLIILKIFLNTDAIANEYYALFFFIYSLLVIITQIELLHNLDTDYYIHNDSIDAFYPAIIDYVLPCTWSQLLDKTLLNPMFVHYPLSGYLFGLQAKLGSVLDIENSRLFLRFHSVVIGAMIIAIMTNLLLEYKFSQKRIKALILPFGLCTYLYITSAIFSRDIDVCFAYTLAGYVCLSPRIKKKYLYFVIVFFLCSGFRPENGLVYLIFPFMYYYKEIREKFGKSRLILIMILVIILFISSQDLFQDNAEAISYYKGLAQGNSGGLFEKFNNLPFPLNTIIMVIYMFLMPLPIQGWIVGEHSSVMNIPTILSPYIMVQMLIICFYALKSKIIKGNIKMLIIASITAFTVITYGSPDLRRAFAAVPALYLCYCLCSKYTNKQLRSYVNVGWSIVFVITVSLSVYTLI